MEKTDEIRPALTAEQWEEVAHENLGIDDFLVVYRDGGVSTVPDGEHVIAALALHGQPFGFTQFDVRMLDDLAEEPEDGFTISSSDIRGLAARIRALLPPE